MDVVSLLLFVPACFALNLSPGPNNLMAMANAQRFGFRTAITAGCGRLVAFSLMIFLAATGVATVLYASEKIFFAVKLVGAMYLFWLAWQLWHADVKLQQQASDRSMSLAGLMRQEFLMAIGNPKAILIFTAFLPQFVNPEQPMLGQFALLGGIFLMLEWLAITIYALMGVYLRQWFSRPEMRGYFNRGCAGLLAAAGAGLMASRQ